MTVNAPTEHMEQATLIAWFKRAFPGLRMFAIPNGAHLAGTVQQRSKQVNKLKAEGMEVGVPDLFLPTSRGGDHGLFIEMKRTKGSVTSKEQKDWHEHLNSAGYKAVVCKGFDEAKEVIECYLASAMSMTRSGL